MAEDRISYAFIPSHPTDSEELGDAEFTDALCMYLGAQAPAFRPYVHQFIPCSQPAHQPNGRVCDAWGHQVGLATLPVADFTPCHDAIGGHIFDMVSQVARVDREPMHLFNPVVPADMLQRDQYGGRPGIVPDATTHLSMFPAETARGARQPTRRMDARQLLLDIKTIHAGGTYYRSARARDEQSGGVAERAHRVQADYDRHARRLDERIAARNHPRGGLGAGPGDTTDVLDHLHSFTRVRGLVCGNYAECSPDVHELLAITADGLAQRRWRLMGARSMTEARAFFIARLRRSLSVVIAREMARHRLRRIPFIGVPRAAIRARQPFRAPQEARHMPQMAQLADFMRFQAYGAAPAAVRA